MTDIWDPNYDYMERQALMQIFRDTIQVILDDPLLKQRHDGDGEIASAMLKRTVEQVEGQVCSRSSHVTKAVTSRDGIACNGMLCFAKRCDDLGDAPLRERL